MFYFLLSDIYIYYEIYDMCYKFVYIIYVNINYM